MSICIRLKEIRRLSKLDRPPILRHALKNARLIAIERRYPTTPDLSAMPCWFQMPKVLTICVMQS
jgi:hypothetical protein